MIHNNRIYRGRTVNLVLSGGGIKGIAYVGVFDAAERMGVRWGNIAGVSAGALAGAYAGAGYKASEIKSIMDQFDFAKIKLADIPKKVPAVDRFIQFSREMRSSGSYSYEDFLRIIAFPDTNIDMDFARDDNEEKERTYTGRRGKFKNIMKNIITYSKEGCLFDGDYLEEWVYKVLALKGIKTFGDLRGGISDRVNPRGYKVRMSAVDASRARIVVLPDDMAFYGLDPDKLEVAKAVRMSTCVPFAFKPVEIKEKVGNLVKTHYMVDGGVLDNFPAWMIKSSIITPKVGFRLDARDKKKLFSTDTTLNVLKGLVTSVHDIGAPKKETKLNFIAYIDTSKVSFLDFGLDEAEKQYLFMAGKNAAMPILVGLSRRGYYGRDNLLAMIYRMIRSRFIS